MYMPPRAYVQTLTCIGRLGNVHVSGKISELRIATEFHGTLLQFHALSSLRVCIIYPLHDIATVHVNLQIPLQTKLKKSHIIMLKSMYLILFNVIFS